MVFIPGLISIENPGSSKPGGAWVAALAEKEVIYRANSVLNKCYERLFEKNGGAMYALAQSTCCSVNGERTKAQKRLAFSFVPDWSLRTEA